MVPILKEANYQVKGEEKEFLMIESGKLLGRFGEALKNR